jgi:hypothetical protein
LLILLAPRDPLSANNVKGSQIMGVIQKFRCMGFLEILICPDNRSCTGDEQSRIGVTVIHTLKMQITE